MYAPTISVPALSKKITFLFFLFLSVLIAAYSPMATYTSAQSAVNSAMNSLKEKALDEIDRRLSNFQATMSSLNVNVHVSKDSSTANVSSDKGTADASANSNGANASVNGTNGSSASMSIAQDGLNTEVNFPTGLKDKVKQFMQKIIDELKQLKTKVQDATSLDSLKSLANNVDSQFDLNQLTQVQATVTQSIQSLSGVFDNLKTTATNLKTQIAQLRQCAKSVKNGSGSVDANASGSNGATVTGSGEGCEGLNVNSSDIADSAESQLGGISSIMSTIGSILSSVIALVTSLISTFMGLAGGLGSLDSLGNLGNLSNLLSSGDLSSLAGSAGSIGGLLSSFGGIASQLDVANGMSTNVQGLLGNLTSLINI